MGTQEELLQGDSWSELIPRPRIESRTVRMPTLLRDVGMAPNELCKM